MRKTSWRRLDSTKIVVVCSCSHSGSSVLLAVMRTAQFGSRVEASGKVEGVQFPVMCHRLFCRLSLDEDRGDCWLVE